jgi:hypothetical protein
MVDERGVFKTEPAFAGRQAQIIMIVKVCDDISASIIIIIKICVPY